MDAPVLLITFNRCDTTRKVFERIKKAKIKKLYIANDAPREGNVNDLENREAIKKMLDEVDWECELHTKFHEQRQGNGFGPVAAINWAFENEEKLIILEDDSVPELAFFEYSNYLLDKYQNDTRIWCISGRQHWSNNKVMGDYDYIFSRFGHTFGWATWKRCWNHFDMHMKSWPEFLALGGFENIFFFKKEGELLNSFFNTFYHRPITSWDARFVYTVMSNSGICIVPAKNLMKNIGIYGAHSSGSVTASHTMESYSDYKIEKEPPFVVLNRKYEELHFKRHVRKIFSRTPVYRRYLNKLLQIIGLRK